MECGTIRVTFLHDVVGYYLHDVDIYSWGYAFTGSLGLGKTEDEDCQPCPLKVNVTLGVNRLKKKDGKKSVKCTSVKTVVGGGQHSILVAHLQEK